jgi:hypothetical protein
MAGEAVEAESLESILAIEDPSERREALIARGRRPSGGHAGPV